VTTAESYTEYLPGGWRKPKASNEKDEAALRRMDRKRTKRMSNQRVGETRTIR